MSHSISVECVLLSKLKYNCRQSLDRYVTCVLSFEGAEYLLNERNNNRSKTNTRHAVQVQV